MSARREAVPTPDPRSPERPRARTATQASRLRGAEVFQAILQSGSRCEGRYVQILTAPAALESGRVGFVVGRKAMRRAVDRNRLKRIMREFVRTSRSDLARLDVVIRVKRPVTRDTLAQAAEEAVALIGQALAR